MRTEETTPELETANDLYHLRRKIDEQQLTIDRLRSKVSLAHGLFRAWAKQEQEAGEKPDCPPAIKALHRTYATLYGNAADWMKEVL